MQGLIGTLTPRTPAKRLNAPTHLLPKQVCSLSHLLILLFVQQPAHSPSQPAESEAAVAMRDEAAALRKEAARLLDAEDQVGGMHVYACVALT